MKKKFKFHCLEDSDSETESSYSGESSDDNIPERNVPNQILNSDNLSTLFITNNNKNKLISDVDDGANDEFFSPSTPPPPLPSSSSSTPSTPIKEQQNEKETNDENAAIQSIDLDESGINDNFVEESPPPSIPEDILYNNDDPPPPEVEEVEDENYDKISSNKNEKKIIQKNKKSSIPKSLKRKNKPITKEKELILNTNRIYDYFNRRIPKLAILKAIHTKCGDYRLAILALAKNSTQFDKVSLFEAPKAEPEMIKKYLKL